jgi:hypothetical protein
MDREKQIEELGNLVKLGLYNAATPQGIGFAIYDAGFRKEDKGVCEWISISNEHDKTSCEHDFYFSEYGWDTIKYCPYCGKLIRVKENGYATK